MNFDSFLMVDWSGGNDRGPTPKKDAIWACAVRNGMADDPVYLRNRQMAEAWITEFLVTEQHAGRRVLAGFDFAFGYPQGFGKALTGSDDPFAVWDWFAARVEDSPKRNNRFDLAGKINRKFPGIGPFWGNGLKRDIADLPRKGLARMDHGLPEKREAEQQAKGAFPVWQLAGAGAVGSQVIMGLPMLARLRSRLGASVWPFEALESDIAIVEIWPSLLAKAIAKTQPSDQIKDAHQVQVLARTLSSLTAQELDGLLDVPFTPEGSILGLGRADWLAKKALGELVPPPLSNDCFAMPQGAYWTPADDALAHLKRELKVVAGVETIAVGDAVGRFLAADISAHRSHPPAPNAAVDGYGFAGPLPGGAHLLPLIKGRAAAGVPFDGPVPQGHAIRILTGANLPDGVDTVVLQEDVNASANQIALHGPLKKGANARAAGEDMVAGEAIMSARHQLRPADLATLSATGIGQVPVHKRLRVGVLSTGDELRPAGEIASAGQIYDANRPMLSAVARKWGHAVIDLGCAPDDRTRLRQILDDAAGRCDVILTSGGASAGDEDHVSALLKDTGTFALWRIAIKPGRPLALGLWQGVPVFGLPGNPVAAFVCAMIFARPALSVMAGGPWEDPEGYNLPAAFAKSKKTGRQEYLRARVTEGQVEVFPSEGSGRVSGLTWATGLVRLSDDAQVIEKGDPVTFIPFGSFGL